VVSYVMLPCTWLWSGSTWKRTPSIAFAAGASGRRYASAAFGWTEAGAEAEAEAEAAADVPVGPFRCPEPDVLDEHADTANAIATDATTSLANRLVTRRAAATAIRRVGAATAP
jgi:hypothetical protein